MDVVTSISGLRDAIAATLPASHTAVAAAASDAIAAPPEASARRKPVAVIGVHGISPIQQYAFGDQLANALLGYLNAVETVAKSRRSWSATTYWPAVEPHASPDALRPTALRLYRDDEPNPDDPVTQVYDVYEGYWSPFSKGKSGVLTLLRWLLNSTFLATSSTARIPAAWRKLGWDAGFLLCAFGLVFGLLALAVLTGNFAWGRFVALFAVDPAKVPTFWGFAFDPLGQLGALRWYGWFQLALDVVIAYLLGQLVAMWRTRTKTSSRTAELRKDATRGGRFDTRTIDADAFHRAAAGIFVLAVVGLGAVDAVVLAQVHPGLRIDALWYGLGLVLTVGLLQFARSRADFIVQSVLGDIQVYTTHDANAVFYAIREQIIGAVGNALLGPLNALEPSRCGEAGAPGPLYRAIHVAGHSLGSTVALDVLIRVRQLVEEGAVGAADWGRIRSFTTFGTALEKTRFFFDVRTPTVSAAQQQWQNDVYGRFFTCEPAVLAEPDNTHGIYWSNHWYERDVVANGIVSYTSDVPADGSFAAWRAAPGAHAICDDNLIPHDRPLYAFVHGDYLGDPLFWSAVGPVLTG